MDFQTTQTTPSPPYLSGTSHREFDCTEERVRLLALMVFSGNMGSGEVVYRYSDVND
jgi:surface-adhesin protein E